MVPSLPKSFPTRPFTAGEEYLMVMVLPLIVTDSVWPLLVAAPAKIAAANRTPASIIRDFMTVFPFKMITHGGRGFMAGLSFMYDNQLCYVFRTSPRSPPRS